MSKKAKATAYTKIAAAAYRRPTESPRRERYPKQAPARAQKPSTPDPEAAALKSLAAARAQSVYMLADSSKFGRVTAATILPLEAAQIITDKLPDRKYLDSTDIIAV